MEQQSSSKIIGFDIGNSNFHLGHIDKGLLVTSDIPNRVKKKTGSEHSDGLLSELKDRLASIVPAADDHSSRHWVGMSVDQPAVRALRSVVAELFPHDKFTQVTSAQIPIPTAGVDLLKTGVDRLLTNWYAGQTYGLPVITVDVGSAVTVDWADSSGAFRGGMIFPGARLAARSLCENTDALPEIELEDPLEIIESVFGRETEGAIRTGIFWNQWGGICHAVKRLQQFDGNRSCVVITGGGMRAFETLVPADWRYDPDLNLKAIVCLSQHLGFTR